MALTPNTLTGSAARAYRSGASLPGGAAVSQTPKAPALSDEGPSFGDMVSEATQSAVETVRRADAVGQAGLAGKADPQTVVEATLAMETTLKTVVSVRDKLVSAYQDVLRMQI